MRIFSSYKDYYDKIQALGQNQDLVYIREQKVDRIKDQDFTFPKLNGTYALESDSYIVGFCGKLYPVVRISKQSNPQSPIVKFCFTAKDMDDFVVEHVSEKQKTNYFDSTKKRYNFGMNYNFDFYQKDIVRYFNEFKKPKKEWEDYFVKGQCPIFTIHVNAGKGIITYNDSLKKLEFYKLIDPYTAFQNLQMYLSNIAVPVKPLPIIDNETMLESKGFDKKFSFRKEKSEK